MSAAQRRRQSDIGRLEPATGRQRDDAFGDILAGMAAVGALLDTGIKANLPAFDDAILLHHHRVGAIRHQGHGGIVANPNCSTMQMVVALKPLHDAAGIERLVISTYQAVSGTGKAAIDELLAPVAGGARTASDAGGRRSTRTRSPSTSCRRPGASPTATTTPTRSAS